MSCVTQASHSRTPRHPLSDVEDELVRDSGPLSPSDRVVLDNLIRAQRWLEQLDSRIEAEGVSVAGSTGQLRVNPLLSEQRALRNEVAVGLAELRRRRELERQIAEAHAITRYVPA